MSIRKSEWGMILMKTEAHSVVNAKEGCGSIGQMADDQTIWLASVLVQNDNICEVIAPAGVHQLADDLHEPKPLSRHLFKVSTAEYLPRGPHVVTMTLRQATIARMQQRRCQLQQEQATAQDGESLTAEQCMGRRLSSAVPVEAEGHAQAAPSPDRRG